jgi:uncharacterized protein
MYKNIALGLLAFAPLVRLALFRGPMARPVEEPPSDILDMHCHIAGIGSGGSKAWVSDSLRKSWKFPLYLKIFETSEQELLHEGDAVLFDITCHRIRESKWVKDAVILAMDAPHNDEGQMDLKAGEVFVPNRYVGEAVKAYPELHFGASVHPGRADAIEELNWSKQNGAVLLKWLPNIQNIDPSNERFVPFYKALVELDLPLLTHVGAEDSFSKANDRLGDPHLLRLPLECGVRVIAAHVASSGESEGQENLERLLEMMPEFPNLVADISTLTQLNRRKYLPRVLSDDRLRGRLMYGTDHPLTNTPLVTPLQFFMNLSFKQLWDLCRIKNPWDRDVCLKASLGVPREVFTMSREYLGL